MIIFFTDDSLRDTGVSIMSAIAVLFRNKCESKIGSRCKQIMILLIKRASCNSSVTTKRSYVTICHLLALSPFDLIRSVILTATYNRILFLFSNLTKRFEYVQRRYSEAYSKGSAIQLPQRTYFFNELKWD